MCDFNDDFDRLSGQLKKSLKKKRYIHSLGVAFCSAQMAGIFCDDNNAGEFIHKAMIAGLLHDCARCYSEDELLIQAHKNNIPVNAVMEANPNLLHAKVGVFVAQKEYNITDSGILDAIETHTTGEPAMTLLQKIVFIADYIEPGRKFHDKLTHIRQLAFTDLDRCVYEICENTIQYVKANNHSLDEQTIATRNYYAGE